VKTTPFSERLCAGITAEAASMNLRLGNSRLALQKIKIATFVGLPDMG
jgi:hypothetical protein